MNRLVVFFFAIFVSLQVSAQELNCKVTIGHDKVNVTNKQIFTTLERSLNDFINGNRWSNQMFKPIEKIECAMFINVTALTGNTFTATLQIQASRPVYNSNYSTPIFNYLDKDFQFNYVEFENLYYNPNSFDSNLTSVLAYYVNIILGLDADSFVLNGGTPYFETAQSIVNLAQSTGYKGWNQTDTGNQNRFVLVQDLLSTTFIPFRKAMYQYHIEGMDLMVDDVKQAKEGIKTAIMTLAEINNTRPNSFLTRIFFDAKADEIVNVYSTGFQVVTTDLVEKLNRISPMNSSKWKRIK
ncbi:MAG: DUF4835 family protein [Bacteroidota bacterium]|nr:DUF4835 family protein [Bacteroidota bacterium]